MTDLLTTRQVQTLLQVDRTTIYRMVENGQLPAVRVGKQWRFAREQVEGLLMRARPGEAVGSAIGIPANARHSAGLTLQPVSVDDDAGSHKQQGGLRELLPTPGAQSIQDTLADLLGVMMVVTDMQGQPVTRISNPSGFFRALTANNSGAVSQCVATWQQFADERALEPRWTPNEMGLLCARALIRVGSELQGMVMLGGIAPEGWPPPDEQVAALARQFGVEPPGVLARIGAVHRLDEAGREKALRSVQRIADVFAHLIEDRSAMQAQLQALIAQNRGQA